MVTGFYTVYKSDYYFEKSGVMQTGWKFIHNNWYYFEQSGAMLKDQLTPDGYRVDKDGVWRVAVETTTTTSTTTTTVVTTTSQEAPRENTEPTTQETTQIQITTEEVKSDKAQ